VFDPKLLLDIQKYSTIGYITNLMAHKTLWHAMKNIGAINSNTQKFMVSQKIINYHENV
jgi:hypothetical protein